MTVINNLMKFCTWRKTALLSLNSNIMLRHYSSKKISVKHNNLEPIVHSYIVQKADTRQILQNAEKMREILKKKGRLSAVDMDLCARINTSTINEILIQLHSFSLLDANYCLNSLFYKVFKEYLKKGSLERLKWDQLIQIIYYMSYVRDEETKELMLRCLQRIQKCPEIFTSDYKDVCVILSSTFIGETIITQEKILMRAKQILRDEIFNLVEDPIWLNMICKGLRLARCYDISTLTELAENLKRSSLVDHFSMMNYSSIIALYGAALYKDKVLLDTFIRGAARNVRIHLDGFYLAKKKGFTRPPRIKDLSRIFYGSMRLDHPVEKNLLETVFVPYFEGVNRQKNRKDYELHIHHEIICLTGFWYMGYDLSLISNTCQEIAEVIPGSHFRRRDHQRCYQFLEILDLVYPKIFTPYLHTIKNTVSKKFSQIGTELLQTRGNLVHLQKTINKFKKDLNVSECLIENIVPSLCLEGVSVESEGKKIHIDVLEIQFCLLDTETPNGIMVTKMKLMKFVPGVSQHIVLPNSELIKLSKLKDADVVRYFKIILKSSKKFENTYIWQI